MKNSIKNYSLVILIILIALINISTSVFGANYDYKDADLAKKAANSLTSDDFFNISVNKLVGKTVQLGSDGVNAFHHVGEYCIQNEATGYQGWGKILNVIDLTQDDKVYVNGRDRTNTAKNLVKLFKAMAEEAETSIKNEEKTVPYGVELHKVKLNKIFSKNLGFLRAKGIINRNIGTTTARNNNKIIVSGSYNKHYVARFIFINAGNGQDQIIFGAKEASEKKGNLKIIKEDEDTGERLKDVEFYVKNEDTGKYVKESDGKISYVATEKSATVFKTNKNGEVSINDLKTGKYKVIEKTNPNYGYGKNEGKTATVEVKDNNTATTIFTMKNKKYVGSLNVIKVDANNKEIKLPNVKFIIKNKDLNKYVKAEKSGNTYTVKDWDNYVAKAEATQFETDSNGEILIDGLLAGNYVITEVENPNEYYEVTTEKFKKTIVKDETAKIEIPNKKSYIDISGYVWIDRQFVKGEVGKTNRDDLFHGEQSDMNDKVLDGIKVYLRNKDGKEVDKTVTGKCGIYDETNGNGEYIFKRVPIEKLSEYYIEFEYDGITYTSVVAHTDKENGSKAVELSDKRTALNNQFAEVNNSFDINNINTAVSATTKATPYSLEDAYKAQGGNEIKYINLGLVHREEPKYSLGKDLYNVRLSINGYNHVYKYDENIVNGINDQPSRYEKDPDTDFNVGVEWGEKNKVGSYTRAIYKSDADYTNDDKSKELNVYLTYRIALRSDSGLTGQINSIIEYYDQRYEYVGAVSESGLKETSQGSGIYEIDETKLLPDTKDDSYNTNGYKKVVIDTRSVGRINGAHSKSVFVTFKLSREAILAVFNDEEALQNVAEINSYTTYDSNGSIYAGYDKHSYPGNAVPGGEEGKNNLDEDDTGVAPSLKLEYNENARGLSGIVFVDEADKTMLDNENIRQGNGKYDDGENKIEGVEVTLRNTDGTIAKIYDENAQSEDKWVEAKTYTNAEGYFEFKGFKPGDYIVTYTWGNETYTVQNYKGTIWTEANKQDKETNKNNWYKVNSDTIRYSDAIDNYDTRKQIDAEMHEVNDLSKVTIKTMDSTTPVMGIGIEETTDGNTKYGITTIETETDGDEFKPKGFTISNVDFGIIERARQSLETVKRVKAFKVKLANGQLLVDATVNEDGTLSGMKGNVTATAPGTSNPVNGQLWLQLDNELIQGAKVESEYEIKVVNNSELDYDTEGYYKYGTDRTNVITITPSGVYDYLEGMVMNPDADNGEWEVVSKDSYNEKYKDETMIEKYFTSATNTRTDENGNIISESSYETGNNIYNTIYEEWAETITETKKVRDVKLADKAILHNKELEKELEPGQENKVALYTSVELANSNEIVFNNDVETTETKYTKNTGRIVVPELSQLYDRGQEIKVTPPTGENGNYMIMIITTALIALVTLGAGVILIKKKVLNK